MDEAVCAIRPGTDVGRYARLLARTHDALLSGDRPPVDPRRLVARSWQRVRAQVLDGMYWHSTADIAFAALAAIPDGARPAVLGRDDDGKR